MSDTMTPAQRHRCMSRIRSKDTKPELKVRKWLWSHGYRYRLNVRSVPGSPDIVMRPYRTAIFVNGCFWHGHGVELGDRSQELGVNPQDLQDFVSETNRELKNNPQYLQDLESEASRIINNNSQDLEDFVSETNRKLKNNPQYLQDFASASEQDNKTNSQDLQDFVSETNRKLKTNPQYLQDLESEASRIINNNASRHEIDGITDSPCCKLPHTNRDFWVAKIRRNQERDRRNYQILHENGWQVIVVWECQLTTKKIEHTMREVELLLNRHFLDIHNTKARAYASDTPDALPQAAEDSTDYGKK